MNVTNYLFGRAQGLIKRISEVRDEGKGYEMADDGGVELEVGEFVYGLTRLLKPEKVLTTGVYTGISDMYIAQGLKDNGFGKSDAIEFDSFHLNRAKELWTKTGVSDCINSYLMKSLHFQPEGMYELMFLDTEMDIRLYELVKFFPHLSPGGYVLLHDFPPSLCQGNINADHPDFKHWPVGEIPKQLTDLVKDGELRPMFFPNPRSMLGFYKPRLDEHKWI